MSDKQYTKIQMINWLRRFSEHQAMCSGYDVNIASQIADRLEAKDHAE